METKQSASDAGLRSAAEVANGGEGSKSFRPALQEVIQETLSQRKERLRVDAAEFDFRQRQAAMFTTSGLFGAKGNYEEMVASAQVRIELGQSMGFSAAESLHGIYVIKGNLCVSAALRAARMQAAGFDWDIEWIGSSEQCAGCRLWLRKDGEPLTGRDGRQVSEAFTHADALRMLTTMDGKRVSILEKDNWKMSPRNMYFARAISNAQRFYAPAVLNPNLLSREEAVDLDDVIEVTGSRDEQRDVLNYKLERARHERAATEAYQQSATTKVEETLKPPPAEEQTATTEPEPEPVNGGQNQSDRRKTLDQYLTRLGNALFWRVLGSEGYPDLDRVDEVTAEQYMSLCEHLEEELKALRTRFDQMQKEPAAGSEGKDQKGFAFGKKK